MKSTLRTSSSITLQGEFELTTVAPWSIKTLWFSQSVSQHHLLHSTITCGFKLAWESLIPRPSAPANSSMNFLVRAYTLQIHRFAHLEEWLDCIAVHLVKLCLQLCKLSFNFHFCICYFNHLVDTCSNPIFYFTSINLLCCFSHLGSIYLFGSYHILLSLEHFYLFLSTLV